MDEKKFFKTLGITLGEWEFGELTGDHRFKDSYAVFKGPIQRPGVPLPIIAIVGEMDDYKNTNSSIADGHLIAASKQMFLKLFYACKSWYNFIQDKADQEFFDSMSEPLTSATGRTWEEILAIANDCGL